MWISASSIADVIKSIQTEYIYKEALIKYFPKKEIRDEFSQEAFLYILERPEHMVDIYNKRYFKYWFLGMLKNQVMSSNSSWHLNFRKPGYELREYLPEEAEEMDIFEDEDKMWERKKKQLKMDIIHSGITHYMRLDPTLKPEFDMFTMYHIEHLTIRDISKKMFDLPITHVFRYIKSAEERIRWYVTKYHSSINNQI